MKRLVAALPSLLCAGWLAACTESLPLPAADDGPRVHTVLVLSNGWHTAIVMPRPGLVATGLLAEADDFPTAAFLQFGWGDRVYYPAKNPTVAMALDAALTATPSVIHMAGLARAPEPGENEVVPVVLTEAELQNLIRAIAGTFKRPQGSRARPLSRGLYPNSNFYDAGGTFHLFNTCNTWTARMMRAGGVDVSASGVVTADDLMARLRRAVGKRSAVGPTGSAGSIMQSSWWRASRLRGPGRADHPHRAGI